MMELSLYFLMIRRPPRSTLFTHTTLFRSARISRARARTLFQPLGAPHHRLARALVVNDGRVLQHRALAIRSEEHTSELQSRQYLVCRLLLDKKNTTATRTPLSGNRQ